MDFPFDCHWCDEPSHQAYGNDNNNEYKWTCAKCGKKSAATLSNAQFELLFDFGAAAFFDGY